MSNQMPIYSHVVQKSNRERAKTKNGTREKTGSTARGEFDPLNHNHGGQFHLLNSPTDKLEKEKKDRRLKEEPRVRRGPKTDPNEGKVEAYLRQNQMSIRQQQHRHSAVRQAEHRVNLRSLPLNEVTSSSRQDRTPTDRHRAFGERERDGNKEHKRERNRETDVDGSPLSPLAPRVRKSSSSQRVSAPCLSADARRFYCREWLLQKIAHSLEQRTPGRSAGLLILGAAGSGKTALCRELSAPGAGAQARQPRALNRRLLASHSLQSNRESSLTPAEFIRSVAMQILSHSTQHRQRTNERERSSAQENEDCGRRNSEEESLVQRFKEMGADDGEDSCRPLLGDSEDQRSDEEDLPLARRARSSARRAGPGAADLVPAGIDQVPQILPRISVKATNPFLVEDERKDDARLYENHENLFLRNVSHRQSKEIKPRLPRQSSEPISSAEQKTDSASENERSKTDSPCKSRIPIANFKYPNKSEVSLESSPKKQTETEELPEYTNLLKDAPINEIEVLLEKKRSQQSMEPPPIPTLPISPRTSIANQYYEKLLSDPDIQRALLPAALERDPDECFRRALLYPLLSMEPKQALFLLVDAVDEGCTNGQSKAEKLDSTQPSTSICVLLSRHQHLLPGWLLLVCTAGRQARITGLLQGFRKITLDELQKPHVSADIQRYVLSRLDTEPRLRARVSSDTAAAAAAAAALDHLRIKSDGCLLYLEKVLDGVADGFIALREIKEIPGTLNGLYLWLCQRLFHGRRFAKVRLLLDVLLAARCGVTEELLYKCLLTKECSVTREDFNRRLHLLRRILVMDGATRHIVIFHHSFAAWLTDVKHCTRRYLCAPPDGHAALAMYYTLEANRLTALEVHNYVLHMTHLEQHLMSLKKNKSSPQQDDPLPLHTILLLWVLDSGCDVEAALRKETDVSTDSTVMQMDIREEKDGETESVGNASTAVLEQSPISSLLRGLQLKDTDARWPKDAKLLRALTQLASASGGVALQGDTAEQQTEEKQREEKTVGQEEEEVAEENLDPSMIHELVTRGDDDALAALLKRHPSAIECTDGTGGTALHAAARAGRAGAAAALLRAGARPDAADADGWSPLRAAAWAGHTEVVEVLLSHGCQVDMSDAAGRTALRAAAWGGHEAVVARLLSAGAAPDRPDAEGRTPLIAAAYMGHADIVRALLDAGADIDRPDDDGRTALSVAALCGAGAGAAALLLERGAAPARADRDGAAPLLVAAFEGHTDICELLLEASADIEATDATGRAALWAAAAAGHAHTVRLLLFWGATVDHMDNEGRTVLTIAAAQGNVEVVRQLLDRGLDEHHRDNSGWTPLHYAAFEGHEEVCQALLEAGAVVDAPDNDGKTALMLAAQEGHAALVASLAAAGAQVEARAIDGKTALRLAALEGHFESVRTLLELGAAADALDADRRSVLYVLALDGRVAMARYLLTAGRADVDTRDAEGRTPLHVSAWQGHTEMVNLLIKVGGADVNGRDLSARSPLHAAAWRGRAPALAALLAAGAHVAAVCAQGATPLGIAAQEGHEECVLLLLQYGADPLQADHAGRTPAKVAWRAGHAAVCRLLEQRSAPSAPTPAPAPLATAVVLPATPPEHKRHSSGSTRRSDDLQPVLYDTHNRSNMSLSFAQQVARRGRRERERDSAIPEHRVLEQDSKPSNRSYLANERDLDILSRVSPAPAAPAPAAAPAPPRAGATSPLYASPPHSPPRSPQTHTRTAAPPAPPAPPAPAQPDAHFARDTHMRIILGRAARRDDTKNKRNGIVTNPAMRLVANVRNGLDSAAANIRRTGVALAASASSSNPAVKTNAFQWRKETPL